MSDLYYSTIGVLAIIIHLIVNYDYYTHTDGRQEIVDYKRYLTVILMYYITDVAWGVLNAVGNIRLLYLDTMLYYVTMAFSVVLCCRYVISFLKLNNWVGRLLNVFGMLFACAEVGVLVLNHFYPVFFRFNENGEYEALLFRYIALTIQVLMFVYISVMSFVVVSRKNNNVGNRNMIISIFGVTMTMALLMQQIFPLLPLYSLGLMLGTLIIHVFIHNEEQKTHMAKISALNLKLREEHKILQAQKDEELALRKEISNARDAAEAANAAKTSFLFNMSHDIRTPMNAIMGFRDLLEKNQEDPVKRANYLQKIAESSKVLLSIINNVLEMARIEKGAIELDETVWSAEQFNDTIYSVFLEIMREKGLEFTRKIDVQHHYVYCDPTKLREVYFNLLSNAYKYTKPGGKVQFLLEELPSDREGYATYRTTVADTGIGMAEDFLPHLFEEFSREANSTHSKIEGTGLGMPIVKRLVDVMGGTIGVESKKGVGTTFVITFSHRIAEKAQLTQVEAEVKHESIEGCRVLLAEDNELNAEIAIAVLSEIGLIVERADDGQDCIDKLTAAEPGYYDMILMDIQMPRMNGYEATKAIRAMEGDPRSKIQIWAMTANAFEEDKREAARAGMNGHLAKPINIHELTKALTRALAPA